MRQRERERIKTDKYVRSVIPLILERERENKDRQISCSVSHFSDPGDTERERDRIKTAKCVGSVIPLILERERERQNKNSQVC